MVVRKYVLAAILTLSFSSTTVQGYPMPTLSKESINEKFAIANQEFARRWQTFAKNRTFSFFTKNFSDEQILVEFDKVNMTRNAVYYENPGHQPLYSTKDFERSQELLMGGFYKAPHLVAFAYNSSLPGYNSSNIILNGYRFLALEGPQKLEHVAPFKRLLINYHVTTLIRLTNDSEAGVFKSENYWHGNVINHRHGQQILSYILPEEENPQPYHFTYYAVDDWADNSGIDPQFLLNFIQKIRKNVHPEDILAVHCSGGVGRTGTFIAAFLILNEIDKQLKSGLPTDKIHISIEELVYKISLQRAYLVGEKAQYLTLYKLAKLYIDQTQLSNKPS